MKKMKKVFMACSVPVIISALLFNANVLNADTNFNYDVDKDGYINILDLIHLEAYLLDSGTEQQDTSKDTGSKDYIISKDYLNAVDRLLADDMEIEKKWLIDKEKIPYDLSKVQDVVEIEQTYLCFSPEMRVRRYDNGSSFEYTVKSNTRVNGLVRNETNITISESEYNDLIKKKEGNTINKTRYQFLYHGDVIAIDIFHGDLDGLAYMEIEFENIDAANNYQTPDWVIADVTSDERYKNGCLARYGIPERDQT